jgi:hypothetical protein
VRQRDVVKTVLVPLVAAVVSAGVDSYMNARAKAKRDDALVVAFTSCVQALEDARVVVEAQKSARPSAPPLSAEVQLRAMLPDVHPSSTEILDEIASQHGWKR